MKWAGLMPLRPRGVQSLQSALPGLCRNPGCPPSHSTPPVSVNPWVLGWGRYTQCLHTNSGACVGLCSNNMIFTTDSFRLINLKNWVRLPLPPPLSTDCNCGGLYVTHTAAEKRLSLLPPLLLAEGRPFPTDSFCLGFFLLKTKLQL